MVVLVGVLLISTTLIEITKATSRIVNYGAPQGVEIVCSPEDPRVFKLHYANDESSEFNAVDDCKTLNRNLNFGGRSQDVTPQSPNVAPQSPNVAPQSSQETKGVKNVVTPLPYMT
ncbi:hypothetical protein E5676_scaffold2392G00270 [Cucumis melo var. makuwa]|uniref:Uncharacterized protein n=1 Tax=Cucumis melo var. makuwa TaxID=1194695 RepID=A0A5D3BWB1_CUCMM|nr:hypothetical protein E6C27_scaffold191G001550 [Cucumis melo var. makuwa]TYK03365.1 hypothetical protein E5676_scaffold2392G00270 [Cucumis melo var. makuwa]